jgi:hypothetical protein
LEAGIGEKIKRADPINRFGNYFLNPNRTAEPLEQYLQIALARMRLGVFDQNPCHYPVTDEVGRLTTPYR